MFSYRKVFKLILFGLAIASLGSLYSSFQTTAKISLEVLGFTAVVFIGITKDTKSWLFILVTAFYFFGSYIYSVIINGDNIYDFLLIYKSLIYIITLLLIRKNTKSFKIINTQKFTIIFLYIFLFRYFYDSVIQSVNRPDLFVENNFELMFLIIIFYLSFSSIRKHNVLYFIILIVVVYLSRSRSGILMLVPIILLSNFSDSEKRSRNVKIVILMVLAILMYQILTIRMQGHSILAIDRVVFFTYFMNEIRDWNLFNYIFGTLPITPLSDSTCSSLQFYNSMFSTSGDGSCYSVVFHSFIIRTIYDHGIFGFIAIISLTIYILRSSNISINNTIVIISVALLNGLSVSSFNSVFFFISMIYAILSSREKLNYTSIE